VLLLFVVGVLIFCNAGGNARVSATGTGIAIKLDGPEEAQVNQTIYYTIAVENCGDYWDRNLTVTNQFPNGTSSTTNIPDLAPTHLYLVMDIPYTIKPEDVLNQTLPCIDDIAKVVGYADINGLHSPVEAETDMLTIIQVYPPPPHVVGGYSVLLEPKCPQTNGITMAWVIDIIAASVYLLFQLAHANPYLKAHHKPR
jgi:uncharacterized repeat protein (TIGR01451 family)